MKTGGNVGVNVDQQLEQKFIPCEYNRIGDAQRCSFRTGSLMNYYI